MVKRIGLCVVLSCLLLATFSVVALESGTDVLVAAAGRGAGQGGSLWVTDLTVVNVSAQTAAVEIFWLKRNQVNASPLSESFSIAAGATLVLPDVLGETFGLQSAGGAFRVVADTEVAVASRIYNLKGTTTFGQGFEGIPRLTATAAGDSTDVAGLREDSSFRTNVVLIDASDQPAGSTVELSLRDANGVEIAARTYTLRRLEPKLFPVTDLGATTFEYATLHAEVSSGSVIVAASKVDNDPDTGDPTTLEAWTPGDTADGTYQFAIYDSRSFAAGGKLVVVDSEVTAIIGTYFNWDKTDGSDPECTLIFPWGGPLSPPIPLADFATGVDVETQYPQSGTMTYTLTFEQAGSASFSGEISAVGSDFSGIDAGCNGAFPALELGGGKRN